MKDNTTYAETKCINKKKAMLMSNGLTIHLEFRLRMKSIKFEMR